MYSRLQLFDIPSRAPGTLPWPIGVRNKVRLAKRLMDDRSISLIDILIACGCIALKIVSITVINTILCIINKEMPGSIRTIRFHIRRLIALISKVAGSVYSTEFSR